MNGGAAAWELKKYVPSAGQPQLPPQLSEYAEKTADEIIKDINRLPFFMTELDDSDGQGGENTELEALKSLVFDGEPHEVAGNFRNQGNECFKSKQYKQAAQYYTQGLEVNCEDASLNMALHLNRAACELELKNYRRCIEDCKKVLMVDAANAKACYRSGRAFFAVDRLDEAKEILKYGLTQDPENAPMKEVLQKVVNKIQDKARAQEARERLQANEKAKMLLVEHALKIRGVQNVKSSRPAELLEETQIRLDDPLDYESQLVLPAMVLYPTTEEFDFVAEVSELTTPAELLAMVMDRPQLWFEDPRHKGFLADTLDCFMETVNGGLVKVGRKAPLNNALMAEKSKAPLFDRALRIYAVPRAETKAWLATWSKDVALAKRFQK